jgi:hypothetical protein
MVKDNIYYMKNKICVLEQVDCMRLSDGKNYYSVDSAPYGITYGEWTVRWWKWFFSTPRAFNPAVDDSGQFAYINQPSRDLWFLAGKLGSEHEILPRRFCKIPSSRSVLFPVINCEVNPLECPELTTMRDLTEYVQSDENSIVLKECYLNGESVPVQRVKSMPEVFEAEIHTNNPFGAGDGGMAPVAADGHWVFLRPLTLGRHKLYFRGSCENGRLNSGAFYDLLID